MRRTGRRNEGKELNLDGKEWRRGKIRCGVKRQREGKRKGAME